MDLTRLQSSYDASASRPASSKATAAVEYSSREVCPPSLLLQHLLRAHSIFLLHHGPGLSELYSRMTRQKFCGALERFWSRFIREWDVLLHGNPAVEIYNGIKLAAGGELGIGVGEEDWGSGEREVLEGFIERTEGLVDIVVSRFGDVPSSLDNGSNEAVQAGASRSTNNVSSWLASRRHPGSSDGVMFSGVGALSRSSLKSVSAWMEWLYKYGEGAYGVRDNPHSAPRRKRRKQHDTEADSIKNKTNVEWPRRGAEWHQGQSQPESTSAQHEHSPPTSFANFTIPPPLVTAAGLSSTAISSTANKQKNKGKSLEQQSSPPPGQSTEAFPGADSIMKYMTLGIYGSSWGIPAGRPTINRQLSKDSSADEEPKPQNSEALRNVEPKPMAESHDLPSTKTQDVVQGAFLIGLRGDLEHEGMTEEEDICTETGTEREQGMRSHDWNRRVSVRTLYVVRNGNQAIESKGISHNSLYHL